MEQAHVKHPNPRRHQRPNPKASGWPEGYFGPTQETSEVVCPNCYRSVNGWSSANGTFCPRCGVRLDLGNE